MNITIPLPPPLNATYRYGNGKYYKVAKVRDWEDETGWMIKKQLKKHKILEGDIYISIYMYLKRDRDIDSSIKPVLDLLQKLKIYDNDSQITFMNVTKEFDKKNPRMNIEVCKL
jgi:Holliday junction resolvase RusA-like endonuclease